MSRQLPVQRVPGSSRRGVLFRAVCLQADTQNIEIGLQAIQSRGTINTLFGPRLNDSMPKPAAGISRNSLYAVHSLLYLALNILE